MELSCLRCCSALPRGSGLARARLLAALQQVAALGLLLGDLDRAAVFVHLESGRGVRALVDPVRHAVVVAVLGAAALVDGGALGSVGTLVEAVEHPVAVGVLGAAVLVDGGALGGV